MGADGQHLYVTNVDSDNMTVITSRQVRSPRPSPPATPRPASPSCLTDNAYVSNLNSGTLTVLDLSS